MINKFTYIDYLEINVKIEIKNKLKKKIKLKAIIKKREYQSKVNDY